MERRLTMEGHQFFCSWMPDDKCFGMQVQPVLFGSIQVIAFYGRIKAKVMCCVHPQLMRPPGYRMETYDSLAIDNIQNLILCQRHAAIIITDDLTRPVFQVNSQGQVDGAFCRESA